MNRKRAMYALLREIERGNEPTFKDFGLTNEMFGEIVELAMNEKLIADAIVKRAGCGNKVIYVSLSNARITMIGLDYLEENSALKKAYKGVKEIISWIH